MLLIPRSTRTVPWMDVSGAQTKANEEKYTTRCDGLCSALAIEPVNKSKIAPHRNPDVNVC